MWFKWKWHGLLLYYKSINYLFLYYDCSTCIIYSNYSPVDIINSSSCSTTQNCAYDFNKGPVHVLFKRTPKGSGKKNFSSTPGSQQERKGLPSLCLSHHPMPLWGTHSSREFLKSKSKVLVNSFKLCVFHGAWCWLGIALSGLRDSRESHPQRERLMFHLVLVKCRWRCRWLARVRTEFQVSSLNFLFFLPHNLFTNIASLNSFWHGKAKTRLKICCTSCMRCFIVIPFWYLFIWKMHQGCQVAWV